MEPAASVNQLKSLEFQGKTQHEYFTPANKYVSIPLFILSLSQSQMQSDNNCRVATAAVVELIRPKKELLSDSSGPQHSAGYLKWIAWKAFAWLFFFSVLAWVTAR